MSGYLGNSPTSVPLSSADLLDNIITSAKIANGTIVNADINASAGIDSTKISGLSSDFVLLATTNASSSASVSFDGYFSSTYTNYFITFNDVVFASNGTTLRLRFRRSSSDISTSSYKCVAVSAYITSGTEATSGAGGGMSLAYIQMSDDTYNTAGYGLCGDLVISNPLGTTNRKLSYGKCIAINSNATYFRQTFNAGMLDDNSNALSGITLYGSSGNIASGTFKLYGLK
jgi:outer membrane protein assembly factor BamA